MTTREKRPPPKTRVVGYKFSSCRFDIDAAQKLLERALRSHVVTQFHAKRYTDEDVVWFNGQPGQALRNLRTKIAGLAR